MSKPRTAIKSRLSDRSFRPTKILTKYKGVKEWQDTLIEVLLAGGVEGVGQHYITKRMNDQHRISADETLNELEAMANKQQVQKFIVPGRGRPKTVWRATTELLK
jgi:hypothetical protein